MMVVRREGPYSSLICEWRKQRDAGVAGTSPLGQETKRLATTEVALEIMGKAHSLLESLSESADPPPGRPSVDERLEGVA